MSSTSPRRAAFVVGGTRGTLRGLAAGAIAALCVLLPLLCHALSQGHAPGWMLLATMACLGLPAAVCLTGSRLSDSQVLAALAAAQLAYHVAYSLPGACAVITDPAGLRGLFEHGPAEGPPPEVLVGGQLLALLIAARLLGVTERLVWHGKPVLAALRRLLRFVLPSRHTAHGPRPDSRSRDSFGPTAATVMAGPQAGRAPPRRRSGFFVPGLYSLTGPMPAGGPRMP
ncbi:hypothetical protein [Streptomyces niveus]|uniref:Uncharacterized protein n=1 Tax=Streptomyces niveus TaxID=193462 RepID=A0A1U9QPA1_STRNV|nr:hypothetical protein [Streptomyces niveus]AQU66092.1 hypothetical protein BBN63_07350 [Streptomyces niveus]